MKHILLFLVLATTICSAQQWSTMGNNIFNSNSGYVGIGTSTPAARLHILDGGFRHGGTGEINIDAIGVIGGRFKIADNGNIGVGLNNPGQKLEVNGNVGVGANEGALTGWGSKLVFQGADSNNDPLCLSRYNLGSNSSELRMIIGDDAGGEDAFVVGNTFYGDGQWKTFLKVRNDGNVGIGTSAPDAKLAVKGTVHANEVKVDLNVQGPDYVFEPTYTLPSLDSVQSYINQNKHLPEVPSAKDMEANGVNLGEMNMLLLKKVEELTLYVIELKKENRLEKEDNEKLRDTLNVLIKEVTTIKDQNK